MRNTLPDLLLNGRTENLRGPPDGLRVDLVLDRNRAVLSLHRDGERETWLLTAFQQRRGPDGAGGAPPSPPYAPAGRAIDRPEGAGPPLGDLPPGPRRFKVYAPTGRSVLVETRVVELDQLIPSHGPDGRLNPAYPHAEGIQPRDRGAAPSQDQVRALAAGLIPDRLRPNVEGGLGAPIIGPDLAVESGNARVAALSLVYRDERFAEQRAAYRAMVESVDPAAATIRQPVLVSARITPLTAAERASWARELNARPVADASTIEQARADAAIIARHIDQWRGREVDAAANAEFVRRFVDALSPEERRGLLDDAGRLTALGAARIERGLLTAAYGDSLGPIAARMIAGETEGMRGLAAALRNVAGEWAALRADIKAGRVPAEYEATPALAEAVSAIAEAQARRLPLAELVLQADIERPGLTPGGLAMLRAMFPDGDLDRRIKPEARLTQMLRGYVERARAVAAGPMLLDLPPVRTADAISMAARAEDAAAPAKAARAGEISPADPQAARLQAAAEEARRLARDPATASAELLEAQRIAAERDLMIPEEAGARSARELLDAADDEAAEAAAAAVCLIGAAA